MPQVTKEDVLDQLRTVNDPELHKDLVTLNMIKNVAICDGLVKVHVELTTPACPLKDTIKNDVTEAVKRLDGAAVPRSAPCHDAVPAASTNPADAR